MDTESGQRVRRLALAPLKGLALLGIALAVLVQFVVTVALFIPGFGLGMLFFVPAPIEFGRRLTNRCRRLAQRWCGVPVGVPYKPPPPPVEPDADGMYRNDTVLYRRPLVPRFLQRLTWVLSDRATGRDLIWMLLHPVIGGALAALPAALIGAGGYLLVTGAAPVDGAPGPTVTRLLGLAGIVVGVLVGPALLRGHGLWVRLLLSPLAPAKRARIEARNKWVQSHLTAAARCLALVALAPLNLALATLILISLALGFGLGLIIVMPPALEHLRWLPKCVAGWPGSGRASRSPTRTCRDRNLPRSARTASTGWATSSTRPRTWRGSTCGGSGCSHDRATWRDLLWLPVDAVVGTAIACPRAALCVYGIWGLALPGIWATLFGAPQGRWYGAVAGVGAAALPVGVALTALGLLIGPALLVAHGWWTQVLLAPTPRHRLALRVQQLTETRADATRRPGGRAAPHRARPARRRAGPAGRGRADPGRGRGAARHRPGGGPALHRARPGRLGDGAGRAARPGPRHPPAGARRTRAGRRGPGAGAGLPGARRP